MWKNPDLRPLLHEIRAEVPISGDDWVKDIEVLVEPGQRNHQGQVSHAHDEWTAVFYVDPAGVPIYINDLAYYPNPGDVVVMPPLVVHRVAENNTDKPRLSFAMLVEDPDIPSKFRH